MGNDMEDFARRHPTYRNTSDWRKYAATPEGRKVDARLTREALARQEKDAAARKRRADEEIRMRKDRAAVGGGSQNGGCVVVAFAMAAAPGAALAVIAHLFGLFG